MSDRMSKLRIVDPVLTELARGYSNAALVAEALFPVAPVPKEAGIIPQWEKEAFKIYNTERAIRGNTNVIRPEDKGTVAFVLKEHDLAYPVDYREGQEDEMNLEQHAAFVAQEGVLLRLEKLAADLATNADNYPSGSKSTLSGTSKFSDSDGVDPAITIDIGKEAIRGKIGKRPNVMVIGPATYNALKFHEKILARIQYSMKGIVGLDILSEIFDIPKIVVGEAIYSSDSGVFADVWGDFAVLAYVPGGNAPRTVYEPSFGYTLRKQGQPTVDTYFSADGKQKFYRYTDIALPKIVGADAGYLFSDCA